MKLITAEKPSVAREYAKVVGASNKEDGYFEGNGYIVTWTLGHLVTLSYPEKYDENLKKWDLNTLPFLPDCYKYEVINDPGIKKQFKIVKNLIKNLSSGDELINGGDSGREGQYIQRLVYNQVGVPSGVKMKRLWIDSQTEAEIRKGLLNAKDESTYNDLTEAAYMRGIEDYSMGINFSRALSCKYGQKFNSEINSSKWKTISVGRVMTCVLGMVVRREREIRNFKETSFYRINADCGPFTAAWKAVEGSRYFESPVLYNDTGFLKKEDAEEFNTEFLKNPKLRIIKLERKKENKQAPLLFNLAELQSECSRLYKISPDETLNIAQKLYEGKLTTYPRTDARVLTTAIAAEIVNNIKGIEKLGYHAAFASEILKTGKYKGIGKTKYTDDSKVTDHYAIIPTGEGSTSGLSDLELSVYHRIIDRFLSIFMPAAVYEKTSVTLVHTNGEQFFASTSELKVPGYLEVTGVPEEKENKDTVPDKMRENDTIRVDFAIKEGKTQPPKRYTSGSMILAMENAGNLIEEEELREQIKSSGIGTPATRAATIKKLVDIGYLCLNKKTQVITPHTDGEKVYDIVESVIPDLLLPKMTAAWERGLSQIEEGRISRKDYTRKLNEYISTRIEEIKSLNDGINFAGKAFEKKIVGKCPVCGSDLTNTKGGHFVCSAYKKDDPEACKFGISAMFAKKMTDDQLKDLLSGKRTSLIKNIEGKNGSKFSAYLQIKNGKVEMEFPSEEERTIGNCPVCGKGVIMGKFGAYCTGKCGMNLGKVRGKQLTEAQVRALLENKPITIYKLKNKEGKIYDAIFTPTGIEDFSYTNKKGEEIKGKQFAFNMSFPKKSKE